MVKCEPVNCWNVVPVGAAWAGVVAVAGCALTVDVAGLLPQAERNAARRTMLNVETSCRVMMGFMV